MVVISITTASWVWYMGLLPDTYNYGLRMCRECWERFPRQRLQRKPLVSDPGMHHGTCVTHVPWCMSGSLTRAGGENVPGIPGACATHSFTYLSRGPWNMCSDPIERYYTLTIKELEVCWPPSLAIPWSACWLQGGMCLASYNSPDTMVKVESVCLLQMVCHLFGPQSISICRHHDDVIRWPCISYGKYYANAAFWIEWFLSRLKI